MRKNETTICQRLNSYLVVSGKRISQVLSRIVPTTRSLVFAALTLVLAQVSAQAQLSGALGIAENTCVLPVSLFALRNCGYSGGANIPSDLNNQVWIGPITSGGFYSSMAAAPGFVFSNTPGVDDNGVPLNSFLIGVPVTPGDGKVAPTVTGDVSVDAATSIVSGSFTIGAGSRNTRAGSSLAGEKTAIESWTSITHILTPKPADSFVVGNAFGGSDYIIGSVGFPPLQCTGTGAGGVGDCYPSEAGARAFTPDSPWQVANGGAGPQSTILGTDGIDIVSYEAAPDIGAPANVGTTTSATISPEGYTCVDTGFDPKEPGSPVDTLTDCQDNPVVWGSSKVDPVRMDGSSNASFDNVILKVSTDGDGRVIEVSGFYVIQYDIIQPVYNSWIGGTLTMRTIDIDGDGVPDDEDAFPNDPAEWEDTDEDGIGNNADSDDDNDGVPDDEDNFPLGQFNDVRLNYWAFVFIETLGRSGVSAGCGAGNYCPLDPVTRAQAAVFIERGTRGGDFSPPAGTGNVFLDVGSGDFTFAADFIEQLFMDGIAVGCGNNNYCPNAELTRAEMAVLLLRAKYGGAYAPPPATGIFFDVPGDYWAAAWIDQLAAEGITIGCGNGNYCPDAVVTREQAAKFVVLTFGL